MNYNFGDRIKARNPITGEVVELIAEPNHINIAFYDHNKNRRFLQDGPDKVSLTNDALDKDGNLIHWDIL